MVKFIIALTRLRIAAQIINEMGRWVNPKPIALKNHKCITCNLIEDKFHFILVCPMYTSFRHYIPKYYTNRPSMFKFIELLNNNNELIVRWLYCFKAFEKKNYFLQLISPEFKCIIIYVCIYYNICMCFTIYCNSYFIFVYL